MSYLIKKLHMQNINVFLYIFLHETSTCNSCNDILIYMSCVFVCVWSRVNIYIYIYICRVNICVSAITPGRVRFSGVTFTRNPPTGTVCCPTRLPRQRELRVTKIKACFIKRTLTNHVHENVAKPLPVSIGTSVLQQKE